MTRPTGFSILIPSWNNLPYLKLCVDSIEQNSVLKHQIIIHVNEGSDGTLEWVKERGLEFSYTKENSGVCVAVNQAAHLANYDYLVFMNDDMYACPNWDSALFQEAEQLKNQMFLLSGTMIEPKHTGNPAVIHADFGSSLDTFQKDALIESAPTKKDWQGASWPPILVNKNLWIQVGGFSEEFSPGMYSDPDFSMKFWDAGCRIFKGVGKSTVYHFQCKTTGKIQVNNGRIQFLKKWGILPSTFYKYYLKMGSDFTGRLKKPTLSPLFILHRIRGAMINLLN